MVVGIKFAVPLIYPVSECMPQQCIISKQGYVHFTLCFKDDA